MKRVGTEQAGFSVVFDAEARAVRVRAWGFWSADVAAAFAKTIVDVCLGTPKGGVLFLDMTGLKPMRDEGQASFGTLMASLPKLGIARAIVTIDNPLTKLQLLRLAAEHGRKDCVEFTSGTADSSQVAQKER